VTPSVKSFLMFSYLCLCMYLYTHVHKQHTC
jgi:hypothetical protein